MARKARKKETQSGPGAITTTATGKRRGEFVEAADRETTGSEVRDRLIARYPEAPKEFLVAVAGRLAGLAEETRLLRQKGALNERTRKGINTEGDLLLKAAKVIQGARDALDDVGSDFIVTVAAEDYEEPGDYVEPGTTIDAPEDGI